MWSQFCICAGQLFLAGSVRTLSAAFSKSKILSTISPCRGLSCPQEVKAYFEVARYYVVPISLWDMPGMLT